MASQSLCEPPRATGHPAVCAATINPSAYPAVASFSSGTMLCAATPANIARVRSLRNRCVARPTADRIACRPNDAIVIG
jgi:hypothetical protein